MAHWTATEVPDLSGRVAVVTGANSGIGWEMARVLAGRGATVVLACRDLERARQAAREIGGRTEVAELDLARLASVRAAATAITGRFPRIDLLVNNAGVMAIPYQRSADGFE